MEIRIDITSDELEKVVRVAGRLTGSAVDQFRKVCDPIKGPFILDLSSLMFADDAGIDVLRTLSAKGAALRGASPFIQLLLDDTSVKETGGAG